MDCHVGHAYWKDLTTQMKARQRLAYRPGTNANRKSQLRHYFAFCKTWQLAPWDTQPLHICNFIEVLCQRLKSYTSVLNYVSTLRFAFTSLAPNCLQSLDDMQVKLMLRAAKFTLRTVPCGKLPISMSLLRRLCAATVPLGLPGIILRCAFTFGFFAFLRQSNLAPRTRAQFDSTRHTTRGDVSQATPGLILHLKWSKNRQHPEEATDVPLPTVNNALVCPLQCFRDMCRRIPATDSSPLLCWSDNSPVTSTWVVKQLQQLLRGLGIDPDRYSLHSLRRGGATCAYRAGVDFLHIQRHGGWRSDAFWVYLASENPAASPVASALAAASN